MDRITISIDEIKKNPSLDLSERKAMFAKKSPNMTDEDLEELALASIKNEYEYLVNSPDVPSIEYIQTQILNGHVFSQDELLKIYLLPENIGKIPPPPGVSREEMNERMKPYLDMEYNKTPEQIKYEELSKKINENNGITQEDFYDLCATMGMDDEWTETLRQGFERKGLIIENYQEGPKR